MEIYPQTLDALFTSLDTRFQAGFDETPSWYRGVVTEVPSNTRSNTYAWMDTIPRFREWVGERVVRSLIARAYVIPNKDWELTLEVDRNDIKDNNLGLAGVSAASLGQSAAKWPDEVMADVIKAGTTNLAFDGQPFFDDSHPVDSGNPGSATYSNLLTGTPLTPANFAAARAAMGSFVSMNGRPLGVRPTTLLVPPQLRLVADTILNASIIAPAVGFGGNANGVAVSNVQTNAAQVVEVPEFADEPTVWYLVDQSKPIRPFIFQLREAPKFTSLTDPTAHNVFWLKKYVYGADSRGNGGYSLPFLAVRCEA